MQVSDQKAQTYIGEGGKRSEDKSENKSENRSENKSENKSENDV